MQRRDFLRTASAALAAFGLPAFVAGAADSRQVGLRRLGRPQPFDYAWLKGQARALSEADYRSHRQTLPAPVEALDWDQYQSIRYRQDHALWADGAGRFQAKFFHLGLYFHSPVRMYDVVDGQAQELAYDPEAFDYGRSGLKRAKLPADLGFAGFRLNTRKDTERDFAAFLGASYFRAVGVEGQYGQSARGLAIDTGLDRPEEFPDFIAYWLERPAADSDTIVVYALLDSPSVAGAYRFAITNGEVLLMDIDCALYPRKPIERLGIAPCTSMYQVGENDRRMAWDWRPEIHDTDGLSMWTGAGEWIWRPLCNPPHLRFNMFVDHNPRGFGLLQRGREFWRYEDLKDRYDLRPSAWIEPHGNWGKGAVELVEIPTIDETNDNIVAYWVPAEPARKGQMLQFAYRMHWTMNEPALHAANNGWVRQTFHTSGERLQRNLVRQLDGSMAWNIDFEGPALANLPVGTVLQPQVSASPNAELLETQLQPNPAIRGWRLLIRARVKDPAQPVELRAALAQNGRAVTETWSYQLPPNAQNLKIIP